MKQVTELAKSFHPGSDRAEHSMGAQRSVPESAVILVNRLFADLQVIFPAWRLAFPTQTALDNAKRTWTLALFENDIHHSEQIKLGLRKARASGSPHIPSAGQFINWCRLTPEDLGLPSVEKAFSMIGLMRDSVTKRTTPEVIQAAFNQIEYWDLTHLSEKDLFPIFKAHYQKLIEKVSRGEDISQLCPKALPKNKVTETIEQKQKRKESGFKNIENLRAKYPSLRAKRLGRANG